MKKKLLAFLLLLYVGVILVLNASQVMALSYYVFDEWGGTYCDAEKSPTNTEDDLMCWAAAASNILAWTGWADVPEMDFQSADDIFQYYQYYWTDQGGSAYYAWDWWFDGTNNSQGDEFETAGYSQVNIEGGGGFWDDYNFNDYFSKIMATMGYISSYLDNGYGIVLGVTDGEDQGHAVSIWGYEYDETGNYLGIYITDSDDSKNSETPDDILQYYDLEFDSRTQKWYLQNFYDSNRWYIAEALVLAQAPEDIHSTPEPSSLVLLALGLFGASLLSPRFRLYPHRLL